METYNLNLQRLGALELSASHCAAYASTAACGSRIQQTYFETRHEAGTSTTNTMRKVKHHPTHFTPFFCAAKIASKNNHKNQPINPDHKTNTGTHQSACIKAVLLYSTNFLPVVGVCRTSMMSSTSKSFKCSSQSTSQPATTYPNCQHITSFQNIIIYQFIVVAL